MTAEDRLVPAAALQMCPPSVVYEIYQDSAGKWRWRMKTNGGVAIGEAPVAYDTKAACLDSVERQRDTLDGAIHEV